MKNSTTLSYTTVSSIPKLKTIGLVGMLSFWALPAVAATDTRVEVSPRLPRNGQVAVGVKVLDGNNIPIEGLAREDFVVEAGKIDASGQVPTFERLETFRLVKPESQVQLEPAKIILLLDMSGSMKHKDSSGKQKLAGAIEAIEAFVKSVRNDRIPAQIAIVPFGENSGQKGDYPVDSAIIRNLLKPANSPDIDEQLTRLKNTTPVASTNLYSPLTEAVQFLANEGVDRQPNSSNPAIVPPRLSVILFSDGFHNHNQRQTEESEFANLTAIVRKYPQVRVHTLGYGEPLITLRDRAINCNISDALLDTVRGINRIQGCKLPKGSLPIYDFIVDRPRLKQIASLGSGVGEFPKDAAGAAKSLYTIFTSLREYELQFSPPDAEAADRYRVRVSVNASTKALQGGSNPVDTTIPTFSYHYLPLFPHRMTIGLFGFAGLGASMWIFYKWSQALKKAEKAS
jgi:hypothetical protein